MKTYTKFNHTCAFAVLALLLAGAGPADCGGKPTYYLRCSAAGTAPYYAEVTDVDGLGPERVAPYKDALIGSRESGSGITCSITDEAPTLVGRPE